MTIYVDDMKAEFKPAHRAGRTYVMSHMIGSSFDELHAFAKQLGVARKWFQADHYDITQSKRQLAFRLGAVPITWRQCGKMAMEFRRTGKLPKPPPDKTVAEGDLFAGG